MIHNILQSGVIQESCSLWVAPVVLVRKKMGACSSVWTITSQIPAPTRMPTLYQGWRNHTWHRAKLNSSLLPSPGKGRRLEKDCLFHTTGPISSQWREPHPKASNKTWRWLEIIQVYMGESLQGLEVILAQEQEGPERVIVYANHQGHL